MCEDLFDYKDLCEKLAWGALNEEDNSVREIGKSVISCFANSTSKVDFDAKNQILIALTGYSLQEFLL